MKTLQKTSVRGKTLEDLQKIAVERLGEGRAWRSAWHLREGEEDPRSSKAPWRRVLEFEGIFTRPQHREKAQKVIKAYVSGGLTKYADRMLVCGAPLDASTPMYCRVRQCPVCQWRRSQMWIARTIKALPDLIEQYPSHRWLFLTLTAKTCPVSQLRAQLTKLNKSFARLTQRKDWPAVGYLRTVEVKRRWNGEAHPHIHVLLLVKASYFSSKYVSKAKWSKLWGECLRVDYSPVIHCSPVKKRETPEKLLSAIIGIVKYQTKEDDTQEDRQWLTEVSKQIRYTNGISLGGLLKEYMREEEDALDHLEDLYSLSDFDSSSYFISQELELGREPWKFARGGAA